MELFLNELSTEPLSSNKFDAIKKMLPFVQSVAESKKKGFSSIRSEKFVNEIALSENYSLYNWLIDNDVSSIHRNFLFGMIVNPFIKDEDEEVINGYLESNYYFEDTTFSHPKTKCTGLAAAHLYESLTISFSSAPVWQRNQLPLIIEQGTESETVFKFNLFNKESFEDVGLSEFVENLGEVNLIETDISPTSKSIHLSDHHGKDKLDTLSKRIRNSPHVISMRSTNWGGKQFIRKVYKTGVVEIVLVNSQREYALSIQTTGRNYRETKEIADILRDRYS